MNIWSNFNPMIYYCQNGDVTPSMRIEDVWAEGYSGQGITIAIVDDGLEYTHPDLANNYVRMKKLFFN